MRKTVASMVIVAVAAVGATAYVRAQDAQAEKMLLANERAIMESFVKGNVAAFKQHVAADSWGIDMTGRMATSEMLESWDQMMKDMKIESWDISDTRTIWADGNTAILTYKWTGKGTYQGKPIPSPVWASTVWTKRDGRWVAMFHQETPAMPMPQK